MLRDGNETWDGYGECLRPDNDVPAQLGEIDGLPRHRGQAHLEEGLTRRQPKGVPGEPSFPPGGITVWTTCALVNWAREQAGRPSEPGRANGSAGAHGRAPR